MTIEIHPEAEAEITDAVRWYEERSAKLGVRFLAQVTLALQKIADDPSRFQSVGGGIQVYRMDRWPYKIMYAYDESASLVRVVCVMHNKRRPGYWSDRQFEG
ncbi:type II toxin-antitoxin system RelE/ParE family toxin [Verrucomicrobium sp. BvORR106]|uniref:type II toxin-antitoxin system RelE/ParE family toxin n=1 Tax=Verrucomicrobium sp. BvORR106 TaxID=1403819 RepID=UPI00056FC157|nr:type II toxin-antitoxin system RelE/ParE family toxin [Verrucomicrobium sp. BvORR106]